MLSDHEFRKYAAEHQLTESAIEYISMVRSAEASRMVGVRAKRNICSWIVSEKMGRTISTESRTAEKGFFFLCEYDDRVIEIWDQPQPIKIQRTNKNGDVRPASYTADFLLLTLDGPKIVEVKPEDKVLKLSDKYPADWVDDGSGRSEYLPAKNAFSTLGLNHQVFVYKESHRYRVANIEILLASRSEDPIDIDLLANVKKVFDEFFYWSLNDLKEKLKIESYAPLIQLYDRRTLYGNIDSGLISDSKNFLVTLDPSLVNQAHEITNGSKIYSDTAGSSISIGRIPSHEAAQSVLEKLDRIKNNEVGRSARRWKKAIADGEAKGLTPFQSLLPKTHLRGNNSRRVNQAVDDFINDYLLTVYAKSQGLSIYRSYVQYCNGAKESHPPYDPVCIKTFTRRLKQIPASVIARGRGGNRAENAAAEPTDPVKRSLKPVLPWMSAAIDHYIADVYVVVYSSNGVVYVERPWITAMIDLSTGSIVAITLSFKDPSKDLCSKIIRECVRLHGKLPREILLDRGSDFRSVYFASLLAHYGVTNSQRPSGDSRFGGEIEGFFGEFKKQWLSQRPGNLADYKESRSVDGKMAPKNSAVLTAGQLYKELKEFCVWRDSKPKNNKLYSGADRLRKGDSDFPFIGIPVNYDDEFRLITAVDSRNYKIDFQRGIHIDEKFYWTPNLGGLRGKLSKVEVRRDPENPELVYALINNHWEACYGSEVNSFSSLDQFSQFERGLIGIECVNYRRKIKAEMDSALDLDRRSSNRALENVSNECVDFIEEKVITTSLFDEIGDDESGLSVGSW